MKEKIVFNKGRDGKVIFRITYQPSSEVLLKVELLINILNGMETLKKLGIQSVKTFITI